MKTKRKIFATCTVVKENILSGSILLLIVTILELYLHLFIALNTRLLVF